MKISISPDVHNRFPQYRRRIVIARGINNKGMDYEIEKLIRALETEIRKVNSTGYHTDIKSDPYISAWLEVFYQLELDFTNIPPSIYTLLSNCKEKKKLPLINTIVGICNYISMKYKIPCGVDDLDLIDGNCGLKIASGREIFIPLNSLQIDNPIRNEIIYSDDKRVLCRNWIWHQNDFTKATEETSDVLINIDILPIAHSIDEQATSELEELIKKHCGGSIENYLLHPENLELEIKPSKGLDEKRSDISLLNIPSDPPGQDKNSFVNWSIQDLKERGIIEDIITINEFINLIDRNEKVSIYQGFDPTSPDLHIGHIVSLRVLHWFQMNGHEVHFLIGDATALIGDPSGRSEIREVLTSDQVQKNMESYKEQAGLILDFKDPDNPIILEKNSEWLLSLTLADLLSLFSKITVQRLLERDMFQKRLKRGEPLSYVETIYPLLQGYDSVAMEIDAELGGRDQLFNMLVGRDLCKSYLKKEKYVITTPLLPGLDSRKMSKTYGNTVNLKASSLEKFIKIMEIKDQLVFLYFSLLTDISHNSLKRIKPLIVHKPREIKLRLAYEIVTLLAGHEKAIQAYHDYLKVSSQQELPDNIPQVSLKLVTDKIDIDLMTLLSTTTPKICNNKSDVRRLILQGGLSINNDRITDIHFRIILSELKDCVFRVGKKKLYNIKY